MVFVGYLWFSSLVLCKFILTNGASFYEGDDCSSEFDDSEGVCSAINKCPWALKRIRAHQRVNNCSFNGKVPIVCCPANEIRESSETSSKTTKNRDSSSLGELSRKKCEEYYPSPSAQRPLVFAAVGGKPALSQEYPHMALLGFGTEEEKEWKCGGSLISLQHILTAAHCLYSRDLGDVKFVRVGDLDISTDSDVAEPQDFYVKRAVPHPDYDSASMKNDIAILELHNQVRISSFVKPACLAVEDGLFNDYQITATGWGITEFAGQSSSELIKVHLKIVENQNCRQQYVKSGILGDIDKNLQICAGSADNKKIQDTCQGDSGGPLQLTNYTSRRHHKIIGITSFGKACGIVNSAGVYTKVFGYIPWIESIVFNSNL